MIEIKVGDYVECLDGEIGYVVKVDCVKENEAKFEVKLLNFENNVLVNCNDWFIKTYFKRIGAHDFTVKENKIEPLETIMEKHDGYSVNGMLKDAIISKRLPNTFEMIDKINEIIAYINKEDK